MWVTDDEVAEEAQDSTGAEVSTESESKWRATPGICLFSQLAQEAGRALDDPSGKIAIDF